MGSRADVTVQMISASSTAARALPTASTGRSNFSDRLLANSCACSSGRLHTRTRRMGRTASMASRWPRACVPAPRIARSLASGRASSLVATPETAGVRMAVTEVASAMARRQPCSVSKSNTTPW